MAITVMSQISESEILTLTLSSLPKSAVSTLALFAAFDFDFAFALTPTLQFGVHFGIYQGGLGSSSGSMQLKVTPH
jgi:hypothetical protein